MLQREMRESNILYVKQIPKDSQQMLHMVPFMKGKDAREGHQVPSTNGTYNIVNCIAIPAEKRDEDQTMKQ